MLGAQTERMHSAWQGPGAGICAHYTYLQTLTSSHCPLLPDTPNCHIPLHSEVWLPLPAFLIQNLKMGRKNEELHAEKEAGEVSHLNITEFGASIWLRQHDSGLQRSDLETNTKSHWMAPGQSAGVQVFSPPSCSSASLTESPDIAYRQFWKLCYPLSPPAHTTTLLVLAMSLVLLNLSSHTFMLPKIFYSKTHMLSK